MLRPAAFAFRARLFSLPAASLKQVVCWLSCPAALALSLTALAGPVGTLRVAPKLPAAPAAPAATADSTTRWLRGRVWDAYTQEPLPQASVWLRSLGQGAICDEFGYFTLAISSEQLAQQPADSLLVGAGAFRPQSQLLVFELINADSLLDFTLDREPDLRTTQPLLATPATPRPAKSTKLRFEPRTAGRRQWAAAPRP